MLPGVMHLDFCCSIFTVGSEFGTNNKKTSFMFCLAPMDQLWSNDGDVVDIFLAHFGPLTTHLSII